MHLILNCPTVNVGQKVDYERQCRRTLARNDLIPTILNFDVEALVQVSHKLSRRLQHSALVPGAT